MIIDVHGHAVGGVGPGPAGIAGKSLLAIWAMMETMGSHGSKPAGPPEDELHAGADRQVKLMDEVGTDVQFTSPRPFLLKHSYQPAKLVHWWCEINNDVVATQASRHPDRLSVIAALPQVAGAPITDVFEELDRCVEDLGAVGVLLNPDPSEGAGTSPVLSDEYWFPLYEKLEQLRLPALVHSAGSYGRESYSEHFCSEENLAILSMVRGKVFDNFRDLRMVIPHGGGAIPYQLGRWIARDHRQGVGTGGVSFEEALRMFWYDTCIYTQGALELLIKTVGADRVLFGTERPGSGAPFDDLRPVIEGIDWLEKEDRSAIFEDNARRAYPRFATAEALTAS